MAKDLAELRGNKWLPRALTKKNEESPTKSTPQAQQPQATELPSNTDTANAFSSTTEEELLGAMQSFVNKLKVRSVHAGDCIYLTPF